jgi:hypothetical protein
MFSGFHPQLASARRALRGSLAAAVLAAGLAPVAATAQQPARPGDTTGALPTEMAKQLEASGVPIGDSMARLKRMTDPNAGKRPGDEKLGCEQIRAEFEDTNRKYTAQSAKQDAAQEAVEADARKAQTEASGPGAVASGFLGGLAAVGAHAMGAGDAYNEKLKAEVMATQAKRAAVQNQFAQEAEATKALADRGQTLMSLGKAKGCTGLVYKP